MSEQPSGHPPPCQPGHMRRLTIASLVFALAAGGIVWLVTAFILRDLSESFISSVLTQAKGEAEAVANLAADGNALGEGTTTESVTAGDDAAIDTDSLLAPGISNGDRGLPASCVRDSSVAR